MGKNMYIASAAFVCLMFAVACATGFQIGAEASKPSKPTGPHHK